MNDEQPRPFANPHFQGLVELRQLLLGLLRGGHVVGYADEAYVFAARAPAGL